MGRAHWTWYFITPAGFCSKFNTTLKSPCTTNNVTHLGNKHGIMKDSPETIAKIDAAKEEEASTNRGTKKPEEKEKRFPDYMVRFAVPLHRTEHPLFRAVHAFALSRKTLRDRVIELDESTQRSAASAQREDCDGSHRRTHRVQQIPWCRAVGAWSPSPDCAHVALRLANA
jgi:hypothetical protein